MEGDGSEPTKTPGKRSKTNEVDRLEKVRADSGEGREGKKGEEEEREVCGSKPLTSGARLGELGERKRKGKVLTIMQVLKRYERGLLPHVDWLDNFTRAQVKKTCRV